MIVRVVAITWLLAAWSAPAQAEDQTATNGMVTATFSFDDAERFSGDLWLTISRGGKVLYDGVPEFVSGDARFAYGTWRDEAAYLGHRPRASAGS